MPINDGQWETTKHKTLLDRMTPEEQGAFRYLYSRFYKDVSNNEDAFASYIVLVKPNEVEINQADMDEVGLSHIALVACASNNYLGTDKTYFQIGWVRSNADATVYDLFDVLRFNEAQTETGHYNMILGQLNKELDYNDKLTTERAMDKPISPTPMP